MALWWAVPLWRSRTGPSFGAPMTAYGVTGPTKVLGVQKRRIIAALETLNIGEGDRIISGAAHGVDTICADWAATNKIPVTYTIPDGKWHNDNLAVRNTGDAVTFVSGGYMARNDETIRLSDVLIAFPETSIEVKRSGTWATVRRARNKGIPIKYFPLDDSVKLCDWRMPEDSAMGQLLCCLECDHEGRHHVYTSGRTSITVYEVNERKRTVTSVVHTRISPGQSFDRVEVCAMLAMLDIMHERQAT